MLNPDKTINFDYLAIYICHTLIETITKYMDLLGYYFYSYQPEISIFNFSYVCIDIYHLCSICV